MPPVQESGMALAEAEKSTSLSKIVGNAHPDGDPVPASTLKVKEIDFITRNDDQEETILLIHGACASGSDWSLVVPYLSSYHLLIPSIFTNSSLDVIRQTRRGSGAGSTPVQRWDSCFVSHLADLVRRHAKNGRAHIVGLSFGGCLAVKLTANHFEICLSLFVSGLPTLVALPLYSLTKPFGTSLMWLSHAVVKVVGGKNVGRFLEGEVDTDPGAWDGKGGGSTVEMNGILTETVMYRGKGDYYTERIRQDVKTKDQSPSTTSFKVRIVAASRKSAWTPVADSPEWATKAAKIMVGERKGPLDPGQGDLVDDIDVKVYEAKRMFHPWSRQDPEMFAQCILATILGTDLPTQGLEEVWTNSATQVPDDTVRSPGNPLHYLQRLVYAQVNTLTIPFNSLSQPAFYAFNKTSDPVEDNGQAADAINEYIQSQNDTPESDHHRSTTYAGRDERRLTDHDTQSLQYRDRLFHDQTASLLNATNVQATNTIGRNCDTN